MTDNTGGAQQTAGEAGSSAQTGAASGGQTAGQNAGGGTATQQAGNQDNKTFTQADLDRIVKERLAEEKQRAQRATEEATAAARGEFEKLAGQRQARIQELETQLKERELQALRASVAAKHKLPSELAARLRGATEAEIEADAKELAKLVTARGGGFDGGAGTGGSGSANPNAAMNDYIRRAAGRR